MRQRWNYRRKVGVVLQAKLEDLVTVAVRHSLSVDELKSWVYYHDKYGPLSLRGQSFQDYRRREHDGNNKLEVQAAQA